MKLNRRNILYETKESFSIVTTSGKDYFFRDT